MLTQPQIPPHKLPSSVAAFNINLTSYPGASYKPPPSIHNQHVEFLTPLVSHMLLNIFSLLIFQTLSSRSHFLSQASYQLAFSFNNINSHRWFVLVHNQHREAKRYRRESFAEEKKIFFFSFQFSHHKPWKVFLKVKTK